MLSEEQTEQLKKQLLQQIDSSFPEDKKELAKQKIAVMNSEELEEFLKQNKLVKEQNSHQNPFRSIVTGETPSYKIDEDENAIAVLEINPISRGHILIIPKEPVLEGKKIPKTISSFAEKVSKKIKSSLKSKDVQILGSNILGEIIINILPIYKNETLESERQQSKPEELEELQKLLEKKPEKKIIRKPKIKKIKEEKLWLPKRVP